MRWRLQADGVGHWMIRWGLDCVGPRRGSPVAAVGSAGRGADKYDASARDRCHVTDSLTPRDGRERACTHACVMPLPCPPQHLRPPSAWTLARFGQNDCLPLPGLPDGNACMRPCRCRRRACGHSWPRTVRVCLACRGRVLHLHAPSFLSSLTTHMSHIYNSVCCTASMEGSLSHELLGGHGIIGPTCLTSFASFNQIASSWGAVL